MEPMNISWIFMNRLNTVTDSSVKTCSEHRICRSLTEASSARVSWRNKHDESFLKWICFINSMDKRSWNNWKSILQLASLGWIPLLSIWLDLRCSNCYLKILRSTDISGNWKAGFRFVNSCWTFWTHTFAVFLFVLSAAHGFYNWFLKLCSGQAGHGNREVHFCCEFLQQHLWQYKTSRHLWLSDCSLKNSMSMSSVTQTLPPKK